MVSATQSCMPTHRCALGSHNSPLRAGMQQYVEWSNTSNSSTVSQFYQDTNYQVLTGKRQTLHCGL